MRILLITPYFYPHTGGSQKYAEELYYHVLKAYPQTNVDVLCYNTKKTLSYEKYRGMTIYRVPCFELLKDQFALPNYVKLFQTIKKLFSKNQYDYINTHTRFFDSAWWTPLVAKRYHVKSILTDHCADHPEHSRAIVRIISHVVDTVVVRIIARYYDTVTVTNKATSHFVQKLGVKNPIVVYGGVDTLFYKPSTKNAPRFIPTISKPFSKDAIIVTFLGRMIPAKGPQLVFDVAKKIRSRFSNVYFVFAGDGSLLQKLQKTKQQNSFFTGSLDRKNVSKLLKQTDILVHPSLHHEGFPNVLLEAGASGCAVIASDAGGTREIIMHQKTGIIVRPSGEDIQKALVELIEDKETRVRYQERLLQKVKKEFDWRTIARSYYKLLSQ